MRCEDGYGAFLTQTTWAMSILHAGAAGKADCIKAMEVNMEVNGQYGNETTLLMAQISEQ